MEINDSPFLCCIQFLGFDNNVEKCKSRKDCKVACKFIVFIIALFIFALDFLEVKD